MRTQTPNRIPIASPDVGPEEEEAVLRVLRSNHLVQGPEVAAFEKEFSAAIGVDHSVAVANGTAALHAAIWVAGVRPGDEVLVPAFTFAATANAVVAVGASPVFVDVGPDLLIDLDEAEAKITERTKAIVPVHLYGLMVDMNRVGELAVRHGLAVIEDAAQAHLARRGGITAGTAGLGAFSLYATKNMMSGEGGVITTSKADQSNALRRFRNHGMERRYHHDEWGLNLRMTDLAAAIARVQLTKLPAANDARRANAASYDQNLAPLYQRLPLPDDAEHVYHQYVVRVPAELREALAAGFQEKGVGVDIHYPIPVNRQRSFAQLDQSDDCPRAFQASLEVLALPVHPKVGAEEREWVVEVANALAGKLR